MHAPISRYLRSQRYPPAEWTSRIGPVGEDRPWLLRLICSTGEADETHVDARKELRAEGS